AASILRLARELRVEPAIVLTGPVTRAELLREYSNADVFVLPSQFESTPSVLREAMASGLPIVSTRVGGIPEVVREDEDALLCGPGDPGELAAPLERLASDPGLRTRLGRNGRRNVDRFSWEQVIPQWSRLFDGIGASDR
ncbi:MAG TPA: glycosyltransferase family 4 protein, partial [Thermoplasmata archaeon]|nr:glycosyltransferase family 4 protein [Thermoplasmata archaeon]